MSEEDLPAYRQFLIEVLQATADSEGDARVIYPLLADNTAYLHRTLAELLRYWATTTLPERQPDEARFIAGVIGNFSDLIQNFPLGDKASNMEIAIAGYEGVLTLFTRKAFPQNWADAQNNLGNAYCERIVGDKAENLEKAIAAYTLALQVYTREAFPQEWADTQNNLGNAYLYRIVGDKADNLEKAIAAYSLALQVRTREAFPQDWATTQNNLGIAYLDRIVGDKAENREQAIAAYTLALQVTTREAFPQDWADTQNNLGIAYLYRIVGGKAENREQAIAALSAALQVYTREAFPQNWATTQNNLGNAYRNRIVGDKAENREMAIAALSAALQVTTREAFPQQWATTQNNLGNAYLDRIVGDKAENLEMAIAAYTLALQVRTREAFPQNHAETLFNLGITYQDSQQFAEAETTFKDAIETVEFLRGEIVSGDQSKRKQAEEWNKLYRCMVEVCLELHKITEAIEYIERSKTRNLVELLFSPEAYPKVAISEALNDQLKQLQQQIEEEKRRVEQTETSSLLNRDSSLPYRSTQNDNQVSQASLDSNYTQLNQLRQQREQLITKIIGFHPIRYSEIHNQLDDQTAIIQFYIFNDCLRAFIITRHKEQPEIWQSEPQDLENLANWKDDYLQLYSNDKQRWRFCLHDKLHHLAEILHIPDILKLVPTQCQKVILVPHRYLHLLPLHALPLSSEEYLIDKFPKGVSYAPSCQLWRLTQEKAQTLSNSQFHNLFAIQNPTDNLEFTDIEVETIATAFQPHHILKKSQATAAALQESTNAKNLGNAHWLHFSCHGYFNFNLPEKSALQLAASEISPLPKEAETSRYLRLSDDAAIDLNKCLTLEDIFQLSLPNCRLVTLSACETGLVDFNNSSDEYIGLPSGFIHAGAASIISSLWSVDDFSTALLMIKFYENLHNSTSNVALALNQAQQWFRQRTQRELLQWLDDKTEMDTQQKQKVKERLENNYHPEQQPFKKPEFWAAFCAVGE
ncbi:CHAT domain-containing protein [Lyngbya aestuarii]|uniref:CHAT domain-containing protein n=1 Tax=Lyngbya aestuarii TaxID=118322 RepID=UPI00403E11EE